MAAGYVCALSLVLLFILISHFLEAVNLDILLPFYFLQLFTSSLVSSPAALLHKLNMRQHIVSVFTPHKWKLASTFFPLPSFWTPTYSSRRAQKHWVAGGVPPSDFIWTFPLFEMASQGPCMINVTTLIYTVLRRVPAEYLKIENFSERLWAGLGTLWFDWQSACCSTFPPVRVMLTQHRLTQCFQNSLTDFSVQ